MTTPAQPAAPARPLADSQSAAIAAIARHVTGRGPGDEHQALTALGVSDDDAAAITGS
jgi:hypothetical protein